MSGATVAFVIFWSAVGGSTLLLLLVRELVQATRGRRRADARPRSSPPAVIPLARHPASTR